MVGILGEPPNLPNFPHIPSSQHLPVHREDSPAEEQEGLARITSYFGGDGPRTRARLPHRFFQERGLEPVTTL